MRAIFHGPLMVRWDSALPRLVDDEGPARLWGVRRAVITGAIGHYREHPERRATIGTEAEHTRLLALLAAEQRESAARAGDADG